MNHFAEISVSQTAEIMAQNKHLWLLDARDAQ